jgi:hypothetical protein
MSEAPAPNYPHCGNAREVHRSRTRVWYLDALMRIFGKRAYRCHAGNARSYARRS